MKNVVIVGSWAKEHITVKNIKKHSSYRVFCYLDTQNPGIISLVDGYKIGSLYELNNILGYVKSVQADLVLVTTAAPLSLGLVDRLKNEGISVFGPEKEAAKLECDKAFTRSLMKKYNINVIPEFKVFKDVNKAINYARNLNWEVAIKPIGLTEGLGVRVSGQQLKNKKEIISYIKRVLDNKIGGVPKVLIEQKITGEEFTIQTLVYNNTIISTPAVQDFKKLLSGGKGLNTASMGSYSDAGYLLPFMTKENYDFSLNIMKNTILAFEKETGQRCCGFLYGQFILTDSGIKLVEYNFRPGDPEWINILSILKENIADIIFNLLDKGEKTPPDFKSKATVCKYIVPKKYPEKMNQDLDISFSKDKMKVLDVDYYYSCGEKNGTLNVGDERGIVFVSKADTIFKANQKVERAIDSIKGKFHHRVDIGSEDMIELKKQKSTING